jgi:hypothetical protein
MTQLITVDDVREAATGATTTLIPDTSITNMITKSQDQALSTWKVYITPTKVFEIRDGQNSQDAIVNLPNDETIIRNPYILKMLQVKVQDSDLDLEYIQINPERGTFRIQQGEGTAYQYVYGYKTRLKYLSGFMERTTTMTESTAAVIVGTSIAIAVDDSSIFNVDDWVMIEGADGNIEAAQITATDTNEITVDQLVQTHEAETLITKLKTEEMLKQFILYDVATNVANYIVGNTSNLATSYSQEGVSATIGVAYTHWRESAERLGKKRDEFKAKIELRLNAMS